MEQDILDHLLQQLRKAIEDVQEPLRSSNSVFVECESLRKLIELKKSNTGAAVDAIRRENLYYLNNIVAEWRLILESRSRYSPAAQIALNGQFSDKLKKIRKDLEGPPPKDNDETSKHGKEIAWNGQFSDKLKKIRKDLEGPPPKDHDETSKHGKEKAHEDAGASTHADHEIMPRGLANPYHVDTGKIWGINDKCKAMERLLVRNETRNKEFQAIGVVGMTGVGKTTFCQVAFNNEQVKKHFLPRIWVEISGPPKDDEEEYKKEMVKTFLRGLGFEDKAITEIGARDDGLELLLFALRKQLQGKRYLVVLDDIWHLDDKFKNFCSSLAEDEGVDQEYKKKLSYGLPKGSGGCVIVTSRSEEWAALVVGEKNLKRLTPLEDDESIWQIFQIPIQDKGSSLKDTEQKIRKEIVSRCAGLPLIAKILGETWQTGE